MARGILLAVTASSPKHVQELPSTQQCKSSLNGLCAALAELIRKLK